MPGWLRNIIAVFITLLVVCSAAVFIFYQSLSKSVAEYNGALKVAGLSSEVLIYRDGYAIPYIYASTDQDAAFALGYCHAQERLFQMDLSRRVAEGRLSEVFGSVTLPYDEMFKTIGIDRTVKRDYNRISQEVKSMLEAYSAGVNAYIKEAKGKYSVEFDALGYDPYQWKPEHSLMIGKLMAWELNISWWTDVAFTHLVQKLGEEKARDILPGFPENAPAIIPSSVRNNPLVPLSFMETDKAFRSFMGFTGTHIGSNNWVVNGKKSEGGKPIIANDPHLALQSPGRWYAAVIRGRTWRAEGVTLPGVPGIVIGKNESISWVMTNAMLDNADFYMEQLDSAGRKYKFNGGWMNIKSTRYFITVKDSERVEINVKETHRGPIISNIHPYKKLFPSDNRQKDNLSMRWTASEFTNEPGAILQINRAHSWDEFKAGLKNYSVPAQNFVYADSKGNIGYYCAGRLPIRSVNSSTFVFDGTTDAADWKGYVPFEQMPSLYNPADNFIASANNKTVKDFPYHLSNLWEPPSRIERITELLTAKEKYTITDFMHYQNDFVSPHARELTPYITEAFKNIKITDNNLKVALELFNNWDYNMSEFSQVPSIEEVFFQFLLRNTFIDEMGESLFNEYVFMANVPYRSIMKMLKENKSQWFDDTKTKQIETRDDIIRRSLSDALSYLERTRGNDAFNWQWGNLHTVTMKHIFHGRYGFVDNFMDIGPYPTGGSGTTLFNTEYAFYKPYEVTLGPSMRYLYDFANPDEFYLILNSGQSGNVFSVHYKDMTEMWLTGKYIKINTNEKTVKNSGYKLLILK
ncbi:MAG: penicillin acylase family protein [Ignavibacteria bacterium]